MFISGQHSSVPSSSTSVGTYRGTYRVTMCHTEAYVIQRHLKNQLGRIWHPGPTQSVACIVTVLLTGQGVYVERTTPNQPSAAPVDPHLTALPLPGVPSGTTLCSSRLFSRESPPDPCLPFAPV
jgi:hypothetical protein